MTDLVASPPLAPRAWTLLRRHLVPLALFSALGLAPLVAPFGSEAYLLSLLTRVMIFAIAALSLDLILGYGALVSFGHAAFLGIGAYGVGILASHGIDEGLVQLGAGLMACAVFALATGTIALRTRGVYFIMITLAFGQMAFFLATSLSGYGGDDGLSLSTRSRMAGWTLLDSDLALYLATLLALLGVYALSRMIVASRFGRVLRGSRENALRLQAIGFNPVPYQLGAYVIAGLFAGLAGFLLANQAEFVSPSYMTWQRSGELIAMVVLGGLGSLHGAIVGAAAFLLLEEYLSGLTEHWKMIFGPLLIFVALFARGGILGLVRRDRHG